MKDRLNIEIIPLNKNNIDKLCSQFKKIDEPYIKTGMLEKWTDDHFKFELNDKWQLSCYAKINYEIVGYRIVSGFGKIEKCSHTHRTSIKAEYQRMGIASRLLENSIKFSKSLNYQGMTGLLNPKNKISRDFLISLNWKNTNKLINGNELWFLTF